MFIPSQYAEIVMTKTNNTHRSTEALSLVPVSLPLGSVGGVLPLPIEHAPAVPEVTGQVRPAGRLRSVLTDQIEDAPRAASELLAFPDYDRLFGALVPKAKDIAEAMVFAHAWTLERRSAERWFDHTREQEMLAWDHAMGLVSDLTGPLLLALERHPALKETLPVLMRFMLAKITAGKRGRRTCRWGFRRRCSTRCWGCAWRSRACSCSGSTARWWIASARGGC